MDSATVSSTLRTPIFFLEIMSTVLAAVNDRLSYAGIP